MHLILPYDLLSIAHIPHFFTSFPSSYSSVRDQKDERRAIGDESIVVTISNPSKRPASACNSLESVPRKRKELNITTVEAESRTPSVIRWKEPSTSTAEQGDVVVLYEPDLNRSPPATSSLKVTSRSLESDTGTFPVLSLTSPSSIHPSSIDELLPVMKRHPDQERWMRTRSFSVDSLKFIHVKCESEVSKESEEEEDSNVIKSKNDKKKSWSFDDLTYIRKRWDHVKKDERFESDRHQKAVGRIGHHHILLLGSSRDTGTSSPSALLISSPRHSCEFMIDPTKLRRMKKEAIITLWKSSERQLLNSLQDVLQEKRALEQKLLVLQQMLHKPP